MKEVKDKIISIIKMLIIPVILVVLWQISGENGWIKTSAISTPLKIWSKFLVLLGKGSLQENILISNISYEMLEWFKSKCFTERIFYAMWYPGSHISEYDGNTIEDLGFGIEELERLGALTWQDLGFAQNPADIDPSFLAIRGGNTYAHMQDHPEVTPRAITLFHYVRKLDNGGIEFIHLTKEGDEFVDFAKRAVDSFGNIEKKYIND